MKISMIGTLPPNKGISDYCVALTENLSRYDNIDFYNFIQLYPEKYYPGGSKKNNEYINLNNVRTINIIKWYNPWSWVKASMLIDTKVVHIQWWAFPLAPIFFTIMLISKIRNKKIVVTIHNITSHERDLSHYFLNEIVIRLADYLIVHSSNNIPILKNLYKVKDNKVFIIPHGILKKNGDKFFKDKIIEELKINADDKNILFFGNIRYYKGVDVLLRSMGILVNKYKLLNVKCIIAGQLWGSWDEYSDIIKDEKIEAYIIKYPKFVPDNIVKYFFQNSYLVVLPYKYFDSQSGVGALALNYEIPLLVSEVGGLTDYVSDPEAIVKSNDPIDLADKLYKILSDDELYTRLKNSTYAKKQLFNWDIISKKTHELYLMAEKGEK